VVNVPNEVSVTVTLHVDPWLTTTRLEQARAVKVARRLTVNSKALFAVVPRLSVTMQLTVIVPRVL